MHYSKILGYNIVAINDQNFNLEQTETFKQVLFEKFGKDFIHLLPYVDGKMIVHTDETFVDRMIDMRKEYPITSDILRLETIKKAVETLKDAEVDTLYAIFTREEIHGLQHAKKQKELIELAQLLHRKTLAILGISPLKQEPFFETKNLVPSHAV